MTIEQECNTNKEKAQKAAENSSKQLQEKADNLQIIIGICSKETNELANKKAMAEEGSSLQNTFSKKLMKTSKFCLDASNNAIKNFKKAKAEDDKNQECLEKFSTESTAHSQTSTTSRLSNEDIILQHEPQIPSNAHSLASRAHNQVEFYNQENINNANSSTSSFSLLYLTPFAAILVIPVVMAFVFLAWKANNYYMDWKNNYSQIDKDHHDLEQGNQSIKLANDGQDNVQATGEDANIEHVYSA